MKTILSIIICTLLVACGVGGAPTPSDDVVGGIQDGHGPQIHTNDAINNPPVGPNGMEYQPPTESIN